MPAKKPLPKPSAVNSSKPAKVTKPAAVTKAPKLAKPITPPLPPEHRAYPALVHELIAQVPLTLADDERAYYEGSITEADALRAGTRYESSGVLDDILQLAAKSLPHVVAGKVAGYGGLRLRYALEASAALAARVDRLDTSLVEASGASAAKTTSLRGTRSLRRTALRALKNLAGKRPEERKRVRQAGRGTEKPDERARSLEAIAEELSTIVAKIPARVAADAGATPELMAELRKNARAVLTTRSEAQGSRGAVYSIYDEMNLLDGRILHEVRLLLGAMTDARAGDKTIPFVRSLLLQKKSNKKKDKPKKDKVAKPAEATPKAATDAVEASPKPAAEPTNGVASPS